MTQAEYQQYLESEEWRAVKKAMRRPEKCVGCAGERRLELHHMIYPADIWKTEPKHCCWLCDPCHETLHRAPAKYIAMATTENFTKRVIWAQRNEEDGALSAAIWIKSSPFLRRLGL